MPPYSAFTATPTTRTWAYQQYCAARPIRPCLAFGGIFTAFDVVARGASTHPRILLRTFSRNAGFLYVYSVLVCPMEAIHGKQSAWHNVVAGSLLGYVGVYRGMLGIPFVDPYFFMRNPRVAPPVAGAAVYGGIAGILSAVGGKPF